MIFINKWKQLSEVKQPESVQKLWSLEKKHFRLPIILFFVIAFIVLTFYGFYTIYGLVTMQSVQSEISVYIQNSQISPVVVYWDLLMRKPLIQFILMLIILARVILSIVKSYQKKSFQFLPRISFNLIFFIICLEIWNLIVLLMNRMFFDLLLYKLLLSFEISLLIVNIFLYLIIIRALNFLTVIFMISFQFEKTQEMMNSLKNNSEFNNLFSSLGINVPNNKNEQGSIRETVELNEAEQKRKIQYDRLVNVPNEKLYEIANKLYIFQPEKLEKEELINAILDIVMKNEDSTGDKASE
ncbi:hypothetical protein ACUZ9N_03005 [Mycoplasmopsis gallinarum]